MKGKIFLFLGPPGSGKGTLSELCVSKFGWPQLSTGNLCRQHIADQTDLGNKIKKIIAEGGLVPDDIIADMVVDWIINQNVIPEGIIFDGYPRTKNQAILLYNFLQEKLSQYELVLVKLNIDAQLLLDRVLNRVVCSNKQCGRVYSLSHDSEMQPHQNMTCDACGHTLIHRSDDTQDSLKKRLALYYQHEQEIIDFYVDKGLKIGILQAAQAMQKLFDDFKKIAFQNYVY